MVHELSQPISALSSYVRTTLVPKDSNLPPPHVPSFDDACMQARRASDMMQAFRSCLGDGRRSHQPMELAKLVFDAVDAIGLDDAASVTFDMRANGAMFHGDLGLIRLLIDSLLLNAKQALVDHPYPNVTVRLRQARGTAWLAIEDNGPGLPPSLVDDPFCPFQSTKPTAAGVGLALGRAIVDFHGGRIWADTERRYGAVFYVTLPTGE